nr:hypothetical protein [uncultured Sulfurimonas sp.]
MPFLAEAGKGFYMEAVMAMMSIPTALVLAKLVLEAAEELTKDDI